MTAHALLVNSAFYALALGLAALAVALHSHHRYGRAAFAYNAAGVAWGGALALQVNSGNTIRAWLLAAAVVLALSAGVLASNARTNTTSHAQGAEQLRQQLEAKLKGE